MELQEVFKNIFIRPLLGYAYGLEHADFNGTGIVKNSRGREGLEFFLNPVKLTKIGYNLRKGLTSREGGTKIFPIYLYSILKWSPEHLVSYLAKTLKFS